MDVMQKVSVGMTMGMDEEEADDKQTSGSKKSNKKT